MNIVIYTNTLDGHHLEYIHHVYKMAIVDVANNYIFLLPVSFGEKQSKLNWMYSKNVKFEFFEENVDSKSNNVLIKMLGSSFKMTRTVANTVKKYSAQFVYTNLMMGFVPFAPLLMRRGTKLVGIIYRIYLYDVNTKSKLSIFQDKLKYKLMSGFGIYHRVLILNDKESSDRLNSLFHTNKFVPISDPYIPLGTKGLENIRTNYGISENMTLFAHFGAMNSNKGTIDFLESLEYLSDFERRHYSFFLAGRVDESIKQHFYSLIKVLKEKVQIVVKDEFCSYEFFASLCNSCDAIVTPYKRTSQSSGLIGYASQFGKPVIAPSKGLLGQLVKKYELGILIDDVTPNNLLKAYRLIAHGDYQKPTKRYCEENTVENFQKTIANCFVL